MMNPIAFSLFGMLIAVLIELALLKYIKHQTLPLIDVIFNLNSGHIIMWIFRGIEIAAFAWCAQHINLHLVSNWHPILLGIFAYIAWDFGFYWLHRMHHKWGWLWAVHVVHHQGEHFNLSLGIRNSWYSSLTSLPFFVFMAILGIPVEVFIAVSSIHYGIQFYNHNGIVNTSGILEKFMVTPNHHRVHHGCNPEYIDKNFGSSLIIWDKLFGTFQTQIAHVPIEYGCHGWQKTNNPFWANQIPILRYLKIKEPDIHPKQPNQKQKNIIFSGGILLFALVCFYVYRQGTWLNWQEPILFFIIALQTIALGGMSDNKPWSHILWLMLNVTLVCFAIFNHAQFDLIALTLVGALCTHSVISVVQQYIILNRSHKK